MPEKSESGDGADDGGEEEEGWEGKNKVKRVLR